MSNLIWINEKELNSENNFISKIKDKKNISGWWSFGSDVKPISFDGEDVVINWSYEFNKVEFYMTKNYFKDFIVFYFYLIYYGEWGEIQEKPIVFMEVYADQLHKKSIKPFKVKDLHKIIKSKNYAKIVIYFETTIQEDPEKESYNGGNNMWISSLGGLYNIVSPSWELNEKLSIKYNNKEFFEYKIEEYIDWKNFIEIYKETAKTAKEMKENKIKWEKFKFNYSD